MIEILQVFLTKEETEIFCHALEEYQVDRSEFIQYFKIIQAALERGETVSIKGNDNHG